MYLIRGKNFEINLADSYPGKDPSKFYNSQQRPQTSKPIRNKESQSNSTRGET